MKVPGHEFCDVQDFDIIALEGVGGVAQHDGAVRARYRHRGSLGLHQFGEAPLVDAHFALLTSVIGHKKLGAAGTAALCVLAMMRGFGYGDSRRVQDFPRRCSDAASPRQIAGIVVGGFHAARV